MKYVAAYLLLKLSGKDEPSVDEIKAIISAADSEFDQKVAMMVIEKLKGQDIAQLIEKGKLKMTSFAQVASTAATSSSPAVAASSAPAAQAEPEKPKEEEEEDEDDFEAFQNMFG